MTVDKQLLFKARLPEADVEVDLEGIGPTTFRVRALSRAEALKVRTLTGMAQADRAVLALGLVDPRMTEGEVREWQEAAPAGELEPITDKIAELSGMTEGAAKAAYKEMDADPDAEFRLFPGREAVDDGGRDAPEDG